MTKLSVNPTHGPTHDSEGNAHTTSDDVIRVAVYGTLKRGLVNHHLLQHAQYLGSDCLRAITLYDLGPYPGAKPELSEGIDIEVYAVDAAQLSALDALEEYNSHAPEQGMYNRLQFHTRFGSAWVYIYNLSVQGMAVQRRGGWMPEQAQVLHISGTE